VKLLERKIEILSEALQLEMAPILPSTEVIAARVIYRSPATWNSSLWINVGRATNEKVVRKNSPVLVGNHVVGVIDHVEEHQSRVRLITDSALTPSVRATREMLHLAKGELYGSSKPLWRSHGTVLKGVGFNYDFPDEKGPSRDLRTGKPMNQKGASVPLIMVNDVLVTTGMDGVFPPDLSVATVTKIAPLKEGDFAYEIEAIPTAPDLDNLSLLFVLPPIKPN
jgi:cell shape-determining protein MreC